MKTSDRRIARYEKLLATLRKTESLLIDSEFADGGKSLERTRQNIAAVEAQLATWKRAAEAA